MSRELTELRQTEKGAGVFALDDIAKGTLVWKEASHAQRRVYDPEEIQEFSTEQVRRLNFFGVNTSDGGVIIESFLAPWVDMQIEDIPYDLAPDNGMFFNHSCKPNLVWASDTTLIAWKDIAAGDELTYDYATEDYSVAPFCCKCREDDCRKNIGGEEWRNLTHIYGRYFRQNIIDALNSEQEQEPASAEGL